MRLNKCSEYSDLGKLEMFPVISTFIGAGRLINKLITSLCACIFSKNKNESASNTSTSLKGRINFWSDWKRGAVALIPFFGNFIIFWHDSQVRKEVGQLEERLRDASEADTEQVFAELPEEAKNSTRIMLDLIKLNPVILKYTALRDDAQFMIEVAKQNVEHLKYAPESMMRDKTFILKIVEATDVDLFEKFPSLIGIFNNDPEVMVEMAKRNLANLQHAPKLMDDGQFVLDTAKKLYDDSWNCYAHFAVLQKRRPDYHANLPILDYAPNLSKNPAFLLKAKALPYLNPLKYAIPHFSNDGEFILKMMVNYCTPGGWWSSLNSAGICGPTFRQPLPLGMASQELKDNVDFMKRAIAIDVAAWRYASTAAQQAIFSDKEFLRTYCNCFEIMSEALRRDKENIHILSANLLKNEAIRKFVSENYPAKVYQEFFGKSLSGIFRN